MEERGFVVRSFIHATFFQQIILFPVTHNHFEASLLFSLIRAGKFESDGQ